MQANINLNLTLVLFISALIVFLSIAAGAIISMIIKIRNGVSHSSKRIYVATVCSMVIAAISWFLNIGWIRLILTFTLFPLVHGAAFLISNIIFAKYTRMSCKMAKLNLLFIVTYLTAYVFMPDGGDVGGMYFFFGMIHNDILSYIAAFISYLAFIGQILFFVLQIDEIRMIKKNDLRN